MTKSERFVTIVGKLLLLLAAGAVIRWVNTGDLFPKPLPEFYETHGTPANFDFLTEPRTPMTDPTLRRLIEQQRRFDAIDFPKLHPEFPTPSPLGTPLQTNSESSR
jgi:hypothetical protein